MIKLKWFSSMHDLNVFIKDIPLSTVVNVQLSDDFYLLFYKVE